MDLLGKQIWMKPKPWTRRRWKIEDPAGDSCATPYFWCESWNMHHYPYMKSISNPYQTPGTTWFCPYSVDRIAWNIMIHAHWTIFNPSFLPWILAKRVSAKIQQHLQRCCARLRLRSGAWKVPGPNPGLSTGKVHGLGAKNGCFRWFNLDKWGFTHRSLGLMVSKMVQDWGFEGTDLDFFFPAKMQLAGALPPWASRPACASAAWVAKTRWRSGCWDASKRRSTVGGFP